LLGKGRVRLLKAIERYGSIHRASKELGISYKKAWHQIEDLNRHAPKPVVSKNGMPMSGSRVDSQLVIRYWGMLEDIVGKDAELVEVPAHWKVRDLLDWVRNEYPAVSDVLYRVAVDGDFASEDDTLDGVREVALMPPFAGG